MKTSTLLKHAEDFLWDGIEPLLDKSPEIYIALELASDSQGFRASRAHDNARHAIMEALGEHLYYTSWATRNGHLPVKWYTRPKKWFPILQANRLNWLRELQEQFKLRGD